MDRHTDRLARRQTTAIKFGERFTCERAVQKALRELEAAGYIITKPGQKYGAKRQGSNVYKIIDRGERDAQ